MDGNWGENHTLNVLIENSRSSTKRLKVKTFGQICLK
jgi:hypothetical protein